MRHISARVAALTALAGGIAGGLFVALSRFRAASYSLEGKVVVVTGGSRGLGLVLAREYARLGAKLVLLARDRAELLRACAELGETGVDAYAAICDVTDAAQVKQAIDDVVARLGWIDVLVNNAGDIEVGPFETMTEVDWERAMQTNFWGPLHLSLAAIPSMRARHEGRIVNISSIGGVISVPHMLPYSASKFALTGFSEGLRTEVEKDGILVTTVCPGLMRTGSPRNALFKGDKSAEYAWFRAADSLPFVSMNAERAARRIVAASRRGEARVILSAQAKVAAFVHAVAPGFFSAALGLVNRFLPKSHDTAPASLGHENATTELPAWVTSLGDRAAEQNNELHA